MDEDNDGNEDLYCDALSSLEKVVVEETSGWNFEDWYQNGIDCYLAREVLYLCIESLEREDYHDKDRGVYDAIHEYPYDKLGRAAWEYVQSMDDFTRLWNSEHKVEVAKEFLECLRDLDKSKAQGEADS